jgi:hypothetical protein
MGDTYFDSENNYFCYSEGPCQSLSSNQRKRLVKYYDRLFATYNFSYVDRVNVEKNIVVISSINLDDLQSKNFLKKFANEAKAMNLLISINYYNRWVA